jgi:hypothetical protein
MYLYGSLRCSQERGWHWQDQPCKKRWSRNAFWMMIMFWKKVSINKLRTIQQQWWIKDSRSLRGFDSAALELLDNSEREGPDGKGGLLSFNKRVQQEPRGRTNMGPPWLKPSRLPVRGCVGFRARCEHAHEMRGLDVRHTKSCAIALSWRTLGTGNCRLNKPSNSAGIFFPTPAR